MSGLKETTIYKYLESKNDTDIIEYLKGLESLEKYLNNEYDKINVYFSDYTKHGWDHTLQVLEYMFKLIISPEKLQKDTLMQVIFCALLHDIGMAFDEEDVKLLPDINPEMNKDSIRDYLRKNHGVLASNKIRKLISIKEYQNCLNVYSDGRSYSTVEIIEKLCESHNKSMRWLLKEFRNNKPAIYIACLLRIADLLDIDGKRADYYYQLSHKIEGDSLTHFTFNQVVGGCEKIKECNSLPCDPQCVRKTEGCCKKNQEIELKITFPEDLNAADEARVRRMVSDYVDEIQNEISSVNNALADLKDDTFRISLLPQVEIKTIITRTTSSPQIDTCKISIDYNAMRNFLFGSQLYPESIYGIREIFQNCYDACKVFNTLAKEKNGWKAAVTIESNLKDRKISIIDNGIGMTDFVVRQYFLNIGKSIYDEDSEIDYFNETPVFDHIGHFGLGFFAIFMLIDNALIFTKSFEDNKTLSVDIDKSLNYATITSYDRYPMEHGTKVTMDLSKITKALMCESDEQTCDLICDYIRETFLFDNINVYYKIIGDDSKEELIDLRDISKMDCDLDISSLLEGIEAKASVKARKLDCIYITDSSAGLDLLKIEYDELLNTLCKELNEGRILFMNFGEFSVFSTNEDILKDWERIVYEKGGRLNFADECRIANNYTINIREFCNRNGLPLATHCDVMALQLLIDGKNVVLCEENVICSKHRDKMIQYDACGDVPNEDRVYLRDVLLPRVHVSLPWFNYRYQLTGLIANIKTNGVFPLLTRDNLSSDQKQQLFKALGYSLLSSLNEGIEGHENRLIINRCYREMRDNVFVRS